MDRDKWFFCKQPNPQASMRLFCFPFGGGGASVFHSWSTVMGENVEVRALQLAGREGRFREPRASDIDQLVKDIVSAIAAYQDKPFAIFGYSLGSLLAFEVSRELRRQGMTMPQRLFIAALRPPQSPRSYPPIAALQDAEFVEKVEYYYQPQGEAWNNAELREFLLPVLKDDIALYESYQYRQEAPLNCPIEILSGGDDRSNPLDATQHWSQQSTDDVHYHVFEGGHFFIDNSLAEIQNLVSDSLNSRL